MLFTVSEIASKFLPSTVQVEYQNIQLHCAGCDHVLDKDFGKIRSYFPEDFWKILLFLRILAEKNSVL
jgi:hypothetical protein